MSRQSSNLPHGIAASADPGRRVSAIGISSNPLASFGEHSSLLIIDIAAARVVSRLFDPERLITGRATRKPANASRD